MPKINVDVYEIHLYSYEVEAESKEEAVQLVKDGLAGDGCASDYLETQKIKAYEDGEDPIVMEEN